MVFQLWASNPGVPAGYSSSVCGSAAWKLRSWHWHFTQAFLAAVSQPAPQLVCWASTAVATVPVLHPGLQALPPSPVPSLPLVLTNTTQPARCPNGSTVLVQLESLLSKAGSPGRRLLQGAPAAQNGTPTAPGVGAHLAALFQPRAAAAAALQPESQQLQELNRQLPIKAAVVSEGIVPLKAVAGISSAAFAQAVAMLPGQAALPPALSIFTGTERVE